MLFWKSSPLRRKLAFLIVFTVKQTVYLGNPLAFADELFHPWESYWTPAETADLQLGTWFLNSKGLLLANQHHWTRRESENLSQFQLDGLFRAHFECPISYYVRLSLSQVHSQSAPTFFNLNGLTWKEPTLGMSYRFPLKKASSHLDLQAQLTLPSYPTSSDLTQNPSLFQDLGASQWTVGLLHQTLLTPGSFLTLEGLSGLAIRYLDFPGHFRGLWRLALQVKKENLNLQLQMSLSGLHYLRSASHQMSPALFHFNTPKYRPQLLQAQVKLSYLISTTWLANLIYDQALSGHLMPHFYCFGIQLSKQFSLPAPPQPAEPEVKTPFAPKEAMISDIQETLHLFKIPQGLNQGIHLHQIFEVFSEESLPLKESIAIAEVVSVKSQEAVLIIREYYRSVAIKPGFTIRETHPP